MGWSRLENRILLFAMQIIPTITLIAYSNKYQGRRLVWAHALERCVVRCARPFIVWQECAMSVLAGPFQSCVFIWYHPFIFFLFLLLLLAGDGAVSRQCEERARSFLLPGIYSCWFLFFCSPQQVFCFRAHSVLSLYCYLMLLFIFNINILVMWFSFLGPSAPVFQPQWQPVLHRHQVSLSVLLLFLILLVDELVYIDKLDCLKMNSCLFWPSTHTQHLQYSLQTGIEKEELGRTLQSLACGPIGKRCVLITTVSILCCC